MSLLSRWFSKGEPSGAREVSGVPEKKGAKESRLKRFVNKWRRLSRLGVALLTGAIGAGKAGSAEAGQAVSVDTTSETTSIEKDFNNVGTYFFVNHEGEVTFNPMALLVPAQGEFSKTTERTRTAEARVMLPYAERFAQDPAAFEAMDPANQEAVKDFVAQENMDRLAEAIRGVNLIPQDHDTSHDRSLNDQPAHITSIRIIGGASPEARGVDSIAQSNEEMENVQVAWARATTQAPLILEQLAQLGLSPETLDRVRVEAQEHQFTDNELMQLGTVADAQGMSGSTEMEKVYNLIRDYNDHKIVDPSALEVLDEAVGEKRSVVVEITTEESTTEHALIPEPLTPVLIAGGVLLAGHLRRRRRTALGENARLPDMQGGGPIPPVPVRGPEAPTVAGDAPEDEPEPITSIKGIAVEDGEPPVHEDEDEIEDEAEARPLPTRPEREKQAQVPELVAVTDVPEVGGPEYLDMLERTVVDDLLPNIGRGSTIRRGLDYELMVEEVGETWSDDESNEDRDNALATTILHAWSEHDRRARQEMSWKGDVDEGLDYVHQPKQITWAKMHARVLRQVADQWRKLPPEKRQENDSILRVMHDMSRPIVDAREEREERADQSMPMAA